MKHEFTDKQIDTAKHSAAHYMDRDWISRFNVRDILAILDALPEPAQQHPEIEFDDVRKGDRIDVLTIHGNREILTVEARTDAHLLATGTQIKATNYVQSIRLISRPVQPPDPAEHPVILVTKVFDTEHDEPIPMIWDGGTYYESPKGCFHAESITDWSPAKVVEDDR